MKYLKSDVCNNCGENSEILQPFEIKGEYNSIYINDLFQYQFCICEKCIRNLIVNFKVKPHIFCPIDLEVISFKEDQEIFEYNLWCQEGKDRQAYIAGKCSCAKDCPNKAIYTVLTDDEFTETSSCEEYKNKYKNCANAQLTKFIPNYLKSFI